ncbi:MAG: LacI family DNA-binding transcriptional regulator [Verrucomicrobiales bacterium]|nr:LacI family DNA-binding transcriptional regulator [Verrucomicrobiales bacterium]
MAKSHITLRDIAEQAGVSAMTVSRALRNDPRVAAATRERIMGIATDLGYRPDPQLSRIMTQLQDRCRHHERETIAVIREAETGTDLPGSIYQYVPLEAIRERAERFGFLVEEFWLGVDGMTPARMDRILETRGIRGVIASPQSASMPVRELDYSRLAAATFGYGLLSPSLHRSAGNMTLAVRLATEELEKRSYRRIGLALSSWVEVRAENAYTATMLHYQQAIDPENRVPPFQFPGNDLDSGKEPFLEWLDWHRPDVLITFDQQIPEWLAEQGIQIPRDIGLASHDWSPRTPEFAGINHRRDHVAAAAVDLVVAQLLQNEAGIPEAPRQILIPPVWVDGESVRNV